MSRTGIHKTTHLHRMAFAGESLYAPNSSDPLEPCSVKVQKGCRIAGQVLRAAEDPEEQDYLNRVFTPALLGSAWVDAFEDDLWKKPNDMMYRVVALPRLDMAGAEDLSLKTWLAGLVHTEAIGNDRPFTYANVKIDEHIVRMMRTRHSYPALVSGSLWLGAIQVARRIETGQIGSDSGIQYHVRESGYKMTEQTIQLARKIGNLPTIEQLSQPYSPLTVEFMQTGPSHLREKYTEAIESMAA